jgi:hypothetical protein
MAQGGAHKHFNIVTHFTTFYQHFNALEINNDQSLVKVIICASTPIEYFMQLDLQENRFYCK